MSQVCGPGPTMHVFGQHNVHLSLKIMWIINEWYISSTAGQEIIHKGVKGLHQNVNWNSLTANCFTVPYPSVGKGAAKDKIHLMLEKVFIRRNTLTQKSYRAEATLTNSARGWGAGLESFPRAIAPLPRGKWILLYTPALTSCPQRTARVGRLHRWGSFLPYTSSIPPQIESGFWLLLQHISASDFLPPTVSHLLWAGGLWERRPH